VPWLASERKKTRACLCPRAGSRDGRLESDNRGWFCLNVFYNLSTLFCLFDGQQSGIAAYKDGSDGANDAADESEEERIVHAQCGYIGSQEK
jgi:hypothetical protein